MLKDTYGSEYVRNTEAISYLQHNGIVFNRIRKTAK